MSKIDLSNYFLQMKPPRKEALQKGVASTSDYICLQKMKKESVDGSLNLKIMKFSGKYRN